MGYHYIILGYQFGAGSVAKHPNIVKEICKSELLPCNVGILVES